MEKASYPAMMAPGSTASSSTPLRCPGAQGALPRLDESLLPEDSPYEILDGQRILTMANPEHAGPQARLAAVLTFHAAPGYDALVELTTRADTAPPPPDLDANGPDLPQSVQELRSDACILRQGTDSRTGDRYVEDLSFEVANEQSLANLRKKAQRLCARGVRRVFGILVKKGQVVEWVAARNEFRPLWPAEAITDCCLSRPLRVRALLDATEAELAVMQALLAKNDPHLESAAAEVLLKRRVPLIEQVRQQDRQEGQQEGQKQALLGILRARGIPVPAAAQARILAMTDLATLQHWIIGAITAKSLDEVFTS